MLTRVIAVTQLGKGVHSKFAKRNLHVRNTLIPSLAEIGISAEIFPAIIGSSLKREDGVVNYGNLRLKIGLGCVGNLLSNYELWKLSVETGQAVLILEDDAILPATSAEAVRAAIEGFLGMQEPNDILYLLSQNPSIQGVLKRYDPVEVKVMSASLSRLIRTEDLSCTAAYCVKPGAALALMDMLFEDPTLPTDGHVHTALRDGLVGVVVQTDPKLGFMLNENWAEWNHKHDPSVKMESP